MIELKNVCKTFYEKPVLKQINMKIEPGDFTIVVGGNGAGKSTLLNLIAGTLLGDTGQVIFENKNISQWPSYRRAINIARVFQDPMLGSASKLTVFENMVLAAKRGKPRRLCFPRRSRYQNKFSLELKKLNTGLEKHLDTKIGLLSGGQRQAVTLVMAAMLRPKLLLLDEHTAALDPRSAEKIMNLTAEVIEQNQLSAFMVTHNLEHALKFGNRLIMMEHGRVKLDLCAEQKNQLTLANLREHF